MRAVGQFRVLVFLFVACAVPTIALTEHRKKDHEVLLTHKHLQHPPSSELVDSLGSSVDVVDVDETALLGDDRASYSHSDSFAVSDADETVATECRRIIREAKRQGLRDFHRLAHFSCSPNYVIGVKTSPDDSYYSSLWGLHQSSGIDIGAEEAWDTTTGSSLTVVGIIDTGVDYKHRDLAANIWTNPDEIAGNKIDDDCNGYVDDVHGINAITGKGDPMDDHGHGTHVAGTIGAVGDNARGVAGINWSIKMVAAKFLDSNGSGTYYGAIKAVNYITNLKRKKGVNVILTNNSWGGGGYSASLESAIQTARNVGILFVAAAGNDTSDNDASAAYPASFTVDNVISVASVGPNGALSSFSNYGATSVDLAAPGEGIISTVLGDSYASYSGTSMATPHVSGALALTYSQDGALSASELKGVVLSTVTPIGALSGKVATGGMLSLSGMMGAVVSATPTPVPTIAVAKCTPKKKATTKKKKKKKKKKKSRR